MSYSTKLTDWSVKLISGVFMDKTKDILILEAAINQFKCRGFAAVIKR